MNAFTSMHAHNTCCAAAVCSSAHIARIMDTAILAVSIVVLLGGLLIMRLI